MLPTPAPGHFFSQAGRLCLLRPLAHLQDPAGCSSPGTTWLPCPSPPACPPRTCGSLKWVSGADGRHCPGGLTLQWLSYSYRPRRRSLKSWGTCGQATTSTWSSLGLTCNRGGTRWCRPLPPMCKQPRTLCGASIWLGVRAGLSGHLMSLLSPWNEGMHGSAFFPVQPQT